MSADGRVVLNKTSKFGVLDVSGGKGSSMQHPLVLTTQHVQLTYYPFLTDIGKGI